MENFVLELSFFIDRFHDTLFTLLTLSFFINPIGASAGGWGTRAVLKGVIPDHGPALPFTLATVAGSTGPPYPYRTPAGPTISGRTPPEATLAGNLKRSSVVIVPARYSEIAGGHGLVRGLNFSSKVADLTQTGERLMMSFWSGSSAGSSE